ncbi:tRNA (adenosine(37)-N6)-dimethylallyltransferase MiaA [Saccharospirillum salsuginis]|uniref:tRNA dimethylallyltransferase n=1 Tax=Saccharospirillum salsuginis TaxID=418750 RepID=A0A918K1Z1_9GAMM|nr:tRNA (adenosine(37)-N6)-dimethylallyltransferase MiaA [Saccharospirillum salsuginis]GGX40729.1 tRNA dimethylallyltransferase [Saccharospirillum salsuginis]
MSADKPLAVFLMGPTAAGKTDLALELVEKGRGEIVSVDSAQVYRGMDIGTAKPDRATLERAPHHLIDLRDPSESYSAADFRNDALAVMKRITERGKVPVLAGGTMLYYKALVEPLAEMPPADAGVREALQAEWDLEGLDALVAELHRVDPDAWAVIDRQNPQRVLRALEVYRISGKPISAYWAESVNDGRGRLSEAAIEAFPWRLLQLAVNPDDRAVLHERIALRFHQMLELGFEAEVRALFERGDLHPDLPSIRAVGYRQMWQYLAGDIDYDRMIETGIVATRQLAKRQLTWLRNWPQLEQLAPDRHDILPLAWKKLRKAGF